MAQQVIPAAQLVPRYHTIGRCNNYAMLQSIPCSPECKIIGKMLLDHPLSYALTATADVPEFTYTMDMFRVTLHLPVETPKNPFVAPVNIQTIEAFMNKVFNRCLTTRTSRHDKTKINILQLFHAMSNRINVDYAALLWWDFMNNVFQKKYPRFIKLIIADLMKKFLNVPQRIDEDYHSIKDDIPLNSEIRATDDFKEYETVFVGVDVPMNQLQPVVSTQGTYRQKHVVEGAKDDDDYKDRLEPGSPKKNPEHVDDDDDEEKDVQTSRVYDLEHGTKCVTTKYFWKTHKKVDRVLHEIVPQLAERATDDLIENNLKSSIATTIIEDRDAFRSEVSDLMKRSLQDQANDPVLWEVPKRKFEKSSTSNTSCRDDDIHSQRHDDHQEDDVPPEGEKRVKRHTTSKISKSARDSSSKHLTKDSTTYVSKQQQQQEWDAWVEETVIYEEEVIPEDDTPELITELQNVDKHVPAIFGRARIEATLDDMLNSFSEADLKYLNKNDIEDLYYLCRNKKVNYRETKLMNSLITFIRNRVIWERVYDFQLGIESYQVNVNLTAPTLTFPGTEAYESYSIVDKPNTSLIYLNSKDERRVMYLVEIVKFCDATLEKVLKEVKLKIFQSEP
ncbi:hypothetical protein Tco_0260270 [Tanacetum coccineum]